MRKKLSTAHDIFTTVVLVILILLTVMLAGVRLVGLQVFTVLSGSMEPTYPTGSLIYVRSVDPHTLQTGDVITYLVSDDTVVTHRIAGIVPDDEDPDLIRFRTKGDANSIEDMTLVHMANVIGTPVFCIPKAGYLAHFIQNPPGTYISIMIASILLMIMFLPDLFSDADEKKKPEEEPVPAAETET